MLILDLLHGTDGFHELFIAFVCLSSVKVYPKMNFVSITQCFYPEIGKMAIVIIGSLVDHIHRIHNIFRQDLHVISNDPVAGQHPLKPLKNSQRRQSKQIPSKATS